VEHNEIRIPGQQGRTVILIASAATMDPEEDVVAAACTQLDAAAATGVDALRSSQQAYGIFSDALQQALCQSIAPEPGAESVIRIFPAWPRDWDAQFKLLCKGGVLVSASMKEKCIGEVTVESQLGGTCRIRNPWFPDTVAMTKNGQAMAECAESLLVLETQQGDHVHLCPAASEDAGGFVRSTMREYANGAKMPIES